MTDKKINTLNETDLSQVAGGTHAESVADDDYTAFYKRVGVTRIEISCPSRRIAICNSCSGCS